MRPGQVSLASRDLVSDSSRSSKCLVQRSTHRTKDENLMFGSVPSFVRTYYTQASLFLALWYAIFLALGGRIGHNCVLPLATSFHRCSSSSRIPIAPPPPRGKQQPTRRVTTYSVHKANIGTRNFISEFCVLDHGLFSVWCRCEPRFGGIRSFISRFGICCIKMHASSSDPREEISSPSNGFLQ